MKKIKNILSFCLSMFVVLSCEKERTEDVVHADKIKVAPYVLQTKSFIESLNTPGTQVVVYDFMTQENNREWYIDGVNVKYDSGTWNYVSNDETPTDYLWVDNSTHEFFGWLNTTNNVITSSFDKDERILSINEVDFTTTTEQYDFLYSEVYQRYYSKTGNNSPSVGNSGDNSQVDLQMKHLFSAFRFIVQNTRDADIIVNSIRLDNICSKKAAEIQFYYPSTVTYTSSSGQTVNSLITTPTVLKPKSKVSDNSYKLNAFSTEENFLMVWPQTVEEFTAVDKEATLVISYTQKGITREKVLKLKDFGHEEWLAGIRYGYTITFTDKEIKLTCEVEPWTGVTDEIEFTDVVTVKDKIVWDRNTIKPYNPEDPNSTYNPTTGEVLIKSNGDPAIATFEIDTPLGAVWNASLIVIDGEIDAFVLESSSGRVGQPGEIIVKANNNSTHSPLQRAKLKITVQTGDGRTILVNNLTPTGAPFHEFILVQEPF